MLLNIIKKKNLKQDGENSDGYIRIQWWRVSILIRLKGETQLRTERK